MRGFSMRGLQHVASVLLLAAASAFVSAAPPVDVPAEVKGEPGAFVAVKAKTEGTTVRFVALDPGLNVFPADLLADKKATVVSAARPGRYRLLAYSSVGNDPTDPAIVTVVIGDVLPPAPEPKPKPDTGMLFAPVQAAFNADTSPTKAADAKSLAAVYRATADSVAGLLTAAQVGQVIKGATDTRVGDRLKPIRAIFGEEFNRLFLANPDAALTPAQKAEMSKQLNRFADVLGKVSL